MLIKPINTLIGTKKDPAQMSFLGMVEDNKDPDKLGRVRVRISPYQDFLTDELPWACPMLGSHGNSASYGGLNVPEIGSQVRVTFPSEDLTAPYYSGAEVNEMNRQTLFDEDYPDTYGYKDSNGNFIKINKAKGTIHLQHQSTTNIQITPDGSIFVNLKNGGSLVMTSKNSFNLSISGVDITGTPDGTLNIENRAALAVKATTVKIDALDTEVTGGLTVGTGYSGKLWLTSGVATVTGGIITSVEGANE